MSTWQLRLMAVGCWLLAAALAIPFLAMYEEYSQYRDGASVTATVGAIEQRRTSKYVTLNYRVGDRDDHWAMWVGKDDARFPPGAAVELRLRGSRGQPILVSEVDDKRPTPLFLVGSGLMLALGIWIWLAPRRARIRRKARTGPLDAIIDAARRTRNMSFGLGVFLMVCAPLFAIGPLFDSEVTTGMLIGLEVLAATTLGAAIFVLVRAYRLRDPRRNDIVDLIERRPHEIAWFYVHEVDVELGGKTLSAHIWKSDGTQAVLSLVKEDLDAVMSEIARRAPHAAHGYDKATEKLYKQQPTRWQPA